MSRRKQSNPKPLLKNECENSIGEMGISRGQDEESFMSVGQSTNQTDDGVTTPSSDLHVSASPGSSTNETTSQSFSNCSSPQQQAHSPTASSEMRSRQDDRTTADEHPNNALDEHKSLPQLNEIKSEYQDEAVQLPKLRLNVILASDPALQPEAKDIKQCIESNNENNERRHHQNQDQLSEDDAGMQSEENNRNQQLPSNDVKSDGFVSQLHETASAAATIEIPTRMLPGFMCGPCGIKFSSLSTLEAHQTYYCTHNRKDSDDINAATKQQLTSEDGGGGAANCTEPTSKNIRTGKQYACSQCSYSADKKVSLNRHMRMHQSSPTTSSVTSNGDRGGDDCSSQIPQIDRYCTDCDIRFSSTKTYRAHKQHYCSSRHREGVPTPVAAKSNVSKSGSQSPPNIVTTPPVISTPPQPYVALPTNPIVIIPYSLIRGGSVLPGPLRSVLPGTTNPDLTCFILKNGSLHPIAQALAPTTTNQQHQSIHSQLPTSPPRIQTPNLAATSVATSTPLTSNESGANLHTMDLLKCVRKKDNHLVRDLTRPLDLSVRRLSTELLHQRERSGSFSSIVSSEHDHQQGRVSIELMMEGKENVAIDSNSVSPEQIVCAPSLPGSPPLTPSPKRSVHSPRGILAASPNSSHLSHLHHHQSHHQQQQSLRLSADLLSRLSSEPSMTSPQNSLLKRKNAELAMRLSATTTTAASTASSTISNSDSGGALPPAPHLKSSTIINVNKKQISANISQPQIFVKQGDSKCIECNIVFCKYENYLAHKKHYCSARNLDEKDGGIKPSPPASPHSANVSGAGNASVTGNSGVSTPLAYQQLICAACGIKFTSLDNLSAHQMYYCPKRIEIPIQTHKEKCTKCKTMHEHSVPCPPTTTNQQNVYKCPICDVVSTNAAESRRHLETHAGVKAFRCSICRYKGNTLRGMRTHIRMHFDKKSSDFNEEHYISCILEEDGLEIPPAATLATQNAQDATSSAQQQQQLHCCEKCNYSSSYKGNVVRHIKLVHSHNQLHQPISPSLGEGGESLLHNDQDVAIIANKSAASPFSLKIKSEPMDDHNRLSLHDQHPIVEPAIKKIKLESKVDVLSEDLKLHHPHQSIIVGPIKTQTDIQLDQQNVYRRPSPDTLLPPPPALHQQQQSPVLSSNAINNAENHQYCNICDIKFKFLNTFIAHKKFYCKNSKTELDNNQSATSPQPAGHHHHLPPPPLISSSPNGNNLVVATTANRAAETSVL